MALGRPGFDLRDVARRGAADGNPTRRHRLGDLTLQINDEQPVLEARALDFDVVGERELPFEITGRDAAVQEGLALLLTLVALQCQDVLLDRQRDLLRREAGERDRNLEAVLVEAFDVVGGDSFPRPRAGRLQRGRTDGRSRWPTGTGAKNLQCA